MFVPPTAAVKNGHQKGLIQHEQIQVLVETPAAILFRKFGADKMSKSPLPLVSGARFDDTNPVPVIALAWGLTTLFSGFMSNFAVS
jgi:hypothetical protein